MKRINLFILITFIIRFDEIIVAQRDYVSRGRSSGAQRKSNGRKKKNNTAGASKTMIALALAILVTFIMGILVIVHHQKSKENKVVKGQSPKAGNGLPPKPEERWNYIKELENRQQNGAGNTKTPPTSVAVKPAQPVQQQLTPEQRELLAQMQADMRQPPTQLVQVSANTPSQRVHQPQQMQTSQPAYTQNSKPQVQQSQPRNPFNQQHSAQTAPVVKTQQPQQQQNQNNAVVPAPIAKKPAPVRKDAPPVPKAAPATSAPVSTATSAPIAAEKAKDVAKTAPQASGQKWIIQCGSFRSQEQAEAVRAKLAFSGITSRISTSGEWHRVILGPYSERSAANNMISQLNGSGTSGCITMAAKG